MAGAKPGSNNGANNYVVNPNLKQVDFTASLYPDLTPELRAAIKQNLLTYYQALQDPTCGQDFLFGQ
ncbi:hypothetical protein L210DRAFT_3647496 [Boletus edulis BED1]|uniref:Uncharacterized protein n=1 Tax=Boletus edulis BED1 TaxID=1328754 RepID=A0AAD4BR50_BOLED|nr:hypothetical protein L210DRAFT_3647496 [Boletus edulis BED1]